MRHLLLDHQWRQTTADQTLPDLQEPLPLKLSVQMVQDQQREHVSAMSKSIQLQLTGQHSLYWYIACQIPFGQINGT
jgi:hypothetical protein